jgi:cytochrome b
MWGSGDDGLVKSMHVRIGALLVIVLLFVLVFGIIQFGNGRDHRFDDRVCTYTYHAVYGWSWVRINLPGSLFPLECHYVR